jgi:hypothetical protein
VESIPSVRKRLAARWATRWNRKKESGKHSIRMYCSRCEHRTHVGSKIGTAAKGSQGGRRDLGMKMQPPQRQVVDQRLEKQSKKKVSLDPSLYSNINIQKTHVRITSTVKVIRACMFILLSVLIHNTTNMSSPLRLCLASPKVPAMPAPPTLPATGTVQQSPRRSRVSTAPRPLWQCLFPGCAFWGLSEPALWFHKNICFNGQRKRRPRPLPKERTFGVVVKEERRE